MAKKYRIVAEYEEKRLDKFLKENILSLGINLSRDNIIKEIKEGKILVNLKEAKPSSRIKKGDEIQIEYVSDDEKNIEKENKINWEITILKFNENIVYEDEYIIVYNKRKGEIVHSGNNTELTLADILLKKYPNIYGEEGRKGIVHRLDKDTSGLMIFAKTKDAYLKLIEDFKNKKIVKKYYSILRGNIFKDTLIDLKIGRSLKNRYMMQVRADGKPAKTMLKVIKNLGDYSLVEAQIYTGRTHQIRVHCSYIKHPVVGDYIYSNGKNPFNIYGQILQSHYLKFNHPITLKEMIFNIEYNEEIKKVIKEYE